MSLSIVFDLDGTLITCENKQKFVLKYILDSYGKCSIKIINDWWKYKRNGLSTPQALTKIGIPFAELITKRWIECIEEIEWSMIDKPFDDSLRYLEILNSLLDMNIYILTARKSKYIVQQTIDRFGFKEYIRDIIIVNPESVIELKKRFLRKNKPVLYVGDSESDYLAALDGGIRFIALSRGQRSEQFLRSFGVNVIKENLTFLDTLFSFNK